MSVVLWKGFWKFVVARIMWGSMGWICWGWFVGEGVFQGVCWWVECIWWHWGRVWKRSGSRFWFGVRNWDADLFYCSFQYSVWQPLGYLVVGESEGGRGGGDKRFLRCTSFAPGKEWNSMDLTLVSKSVALFMLLSPITTTCVFKEGNFHLALSLLTVILGPTTCSLWFAVGELPILFLFEGWVSGPLGLSVGLAVGLAVISSAFLERERERERETKRERKREKQTLF